MIELHASTPEGRQARRDGRDARRRPSPPTRDATTTTARTPSAASTLVRRSGYLVAAVPTAAGRTRCRIRRTTSSSRPDGSPAATPLWRSASTCTPTSCSASRVRSARRPASGQGQPARRASQTLLRSIASDGAVVAAAVSEHGQDLTRPETTAVPTDGGWRIDGRKTFCTMSPAATALLTAVALRGPRRRGALRLRARAPQPRTASRSRTIGTRSACARPAATR